ncbi:MAG: hypothetical protein L0332_23325 [Chloroflexi bacterium]|nr:hypothetical protein [Chloroflexota bacterium]MCI0729623.1 hypothetical protein [Chloroflexota bacterium]
MSRPSATTWRPAALLQELSGRLRIADVNPFAVLMAQVNDAARIILFYAQVLQQEPGIADALMKRSNPILRTDSLRREYRGRAALGERR